MTFYNHGIPEQAISTFPYNPIPISSHRVNPIGQYALRDATIGLSQPEDTSISSDNQRFFSSPLPVVEPPSTNPTRAQASTRTSRSSNAFMIFRSDFVKQPDHVGRRQQELSIMAACAWRALGPDGQTGWYEKAALAKGQHDTNPELKAPRQRPKPYRPRVNARDAVHMDTMRPVRETYATLSPALTARRRMRKSMEQPIVSPSTPVQDPIFTARGSAITSSSSLAHALHPPLYFASHHHHHYIRDEVNTSPTSSVASDRPYGGLNAQQWPRVGYFDSVVSTPISTAASAVPSSPCDSFSPQDFSGFPSPTQYPSPVSPSDWGNRFVEPHYNPPNVLPTTGASYGPVRMYDQHSSRQDHFHRHDHFF